MIQRSDTVLDENEQPVPGALVYVYNIDGTDAVMTSDGTTAIKNPLQTDEFGGYSYFVNTGYYTEDIWFGGTRQWREHNIAIGNPGADLALRTDLAASGGAALVSANDGASGANFTTVAGFIAKLLSSAGTSIVGFLASGTGAVSRALQDKLRDTSNAKDYGAVGDGTTDDRAALALADTAGPFDISTNHRVASNITLSSQVRFVGNGRLTIDSGVTVTFSQQPTASHRQIFYGSGSVAGLRHALAMWFAGDNLGNSAVDSRALLQKAYNAVGGGEVEWPSGTFYHDGTAAISIANGQATIGRGRYKSQFLSTTAACNGFAISGTSGAKISGVGVGLKDYTNYPTSGVSYLVNAGYATLTDVRSDNAYTGFEFGTGSQGSRLTNWDALDSAYSGIHVHDTNDIFGANFEIVSTTDRVVTGTVTNGPFAVNDVVTASGGGTGTVKQVIDSVTYRIQFTDRHPAAAETLTSGSKSATISSVSTRHAGGAVRLYNKAEAIVLEAGGALGGSYSMIADAAANSAGLRPAYCRFSDVYFDSSINGDTVNNSVEFDFIGCWFSNRPGVGITLTNTDGMRFLGGAAENNDQHGVSVAATCVRTVFAGGFRASGNSQGTSNTYDGISIAAGTTDFLITNCVLGGSLGFGTQRRGVTVATGASDRYVISNNLVSGNGTAGVSDGGTGVNKTVSANY